MRKPSQKSIDLYNKLIAQQNKVRKQLKRIHKNAEETVGAGRLPALIIPKPARKLRRSYFEGLSAKELNRRLRKYWSKLSELKTEFSKGLTSYLARTVKDGYMELWLDQIERHSGERPDVFHGHLFSKEQIQESEYGDFMKTYNRLFMLSPEVFLAMLYTGRMIAFKYIYRELERVSHNGAEGSWLEEQNDLLNLRSEKMDEDFKKIMTDIRSPKKQARVVEEAIDTNAGKNYKHRPAYKGGK